MGLALAALVACHPAPRGPSVEDGAARVADLTWLVEQLAQHDAYLERAGLDLARVVPHYRARALAATTDAAWIAVLEDVLGELHDHHASLGTNTAASPRLVPSGADLWGEVEGGHAHLTQVRPGTAAERAGLRAGMEITRLGDRPLAEALAARRPQLAARTDDSESWTLRVLLAGTHDRPRRLTACSAPTACVDVTLEPPELPEPGALVTARMLGDVGVLRLENSLGDDGTVAAFDEALASLGAARALVLDLRNTPSGGSTDVAEPILGRFVERAAPYQQVFDRAVDRAPWSKPVAPRPPYEPRPLVVLVDHWTGSMGEGMAIGLDGLGRARVVGTAMAGLQGGISSFTLPRTGITVRFPTERLDHVDGTPRERWRPRLLVEPRGGEPDDPILAAGLAALAASPSP